MLQHYAKHFTKKQFQVGDVVKLNPELDSDPWVSTENGNLLVVVESKGIEQCNPNGKSGTRSAGFIYDFQAVHRDSKTGELYVHLYDSRYFVKHIMDTTTEENQ